jgi:hypothetical protein
VQPASTAITRPAANRHRSMIRLNGSSSTPQIFAHPRGSSPQLRDISVTSDGRRVRPQRQGRCPAHEVLLLSRGPSLGHGSLNRSVSLGCPRSSRPSDTGRVPGQRPAHRAGISALFAARRSNLRSSVAPVATQERRLDGRAHLKCRLRTGCGPLRAGGTTAGSCRPGRRSSARASCSQ